MGWCQGWDGAGDGARGEMLSKATWPHRAMAGTRQAPCMALAAGTVPKRCVSPCKQNFPMRSGVATPCVTCLACGIKRGISNKKYLGSVETPCFNRPEITQIFQDFNLGEISFRRNGGKNHGEEKSGLSFSASVGCCCCPVAG